MPGELEELNVGLYDFTAWAMLVWSKATGWHDIAPGKPSQNAFLESIIGRSSFLGAP